MKVATGMQVVATDTLGREYVVTVRKVWANGKAFEIAEKSCEGTYDVSTGYRRGSQRYYSPKLRNFEPGETAETIAARQAAAQQAREKERADRAAHEAELRRQAAERNAGTLPFEILTADENVNVTVLTAYDREGKMHTVYYTVTEEQDYDFATSQDYIKTVANGAVLAHSPSRGTTPWTKFTASVRKGEDLALEIFYKLW
jgi:hypothetical protein